MIRFFLFCLLLVNTLFAFDVSVKAKVSASEVFIGDLFSYEIEVSVPQDVSVDLPSFVGNLGNFEVKDLKTTEEKTADKNRKKMIWHASLNTFVSGDFLILPQDVFVVLKTDTLKLKTDPVPVRVLPRTSEAETEILDIEPPLDEPSLAWYFILLIILGVFIVICFIVWIIKHWKKNVGVLQLPPYEEAILALKNLRDKNNAENNQAEFFMELGLVLRRYTERRFEASGILDATVAELKHRLASVKGLEESFKAGIFNLAEETEPVKFAKMLLDKERIDFWNHFADTMLETTKPTKEEQAKEKSKKNGK